MSELIETKEQEEQSQNNTPSTVAGLSDVVIGVLAGIDNNGIPLVVFPLSHSEIGLPARATVLLTSADIGREVALLFESGNPDRPLIIGRIQGRAVQEPESSQSLAVKVDGESVTLSAKKDITLKCGKASITLTKAGKILIRGSYLLSRSSGANRIKGGSGQLN